MDILGIDALFAELTLGLGAAMVGGNLWALFQHRRGERPEQAQGEFRSGRVWFFIAVGTVMTIWGALSVFTDG